LALVEKLPPGQHNEDGTNWKQHGGIDGIRWGMIFSTSPTDDEAANRVYEYIINKNDTTVQRGAGPSVSQSDVAAMVAEQLAVLLKQHADKIVGERERIDAIAKQAANTAVIKSMDVPKKPVKSGIQFKPKKSPAAYAADREANNAMWTERAKILGVGAPVLRPRDNHIDGRWLRRIQPLWDAHVAKSPVAAE
jgi:hypothetical protein